MQPTQETLALSELRTALDACEPDSPELNNLCDRIFWHIVEYQETLSVEEIMHGLAHIEYEPQVICVDGRFAVVSDGVATIQRRKSCFVRLSVKNRQWSNTLRGALHLWLDYCARIRVVDGN